MSIHSCTLHAFPLPDREYYAAAPAQWDHSPAVSRPRRPAPSRARRQKRQSLMPLLVLLGLAFFTGGFLLGRAEAAENRAVHAAAAAGAGGGSPVRILAVPGAVLSGEEGGSASSQEDGTSDSKDSRDDWNLILVNGSHPLPEGFQVPEFTHLQNGHAIDKRAYPPFSG